MASPEQKRATKKRLAKHLGLAIARLRADAGLSQDELAWRADVHRAYLGHIERGEKSITVAMLFQIADGLKLSPAEIISQVEAELPKR